MQWADVAQILAFILSLLAMYAIVLAPFALLALLHYRWCVGLHQVVPFGVARDSMGGAGARLRRGFRALLDTVQVMYPPWYVTMLALVALTGAFVYFSWEYGSPQVLELNLHMGALVVSIVVALVLALLSGSLILAGEVRNPGALLIGSIAWVSLLVLVVWLATPAGGIEDTCSHRWTDSNGNYRHYRHTISPLLSPVYAIVALLFGLWRVGGRCQSEKYENPGGRV